MSDQLDARLRCPDCHQVKFDVWRVKAVNEGVYENDLREIKTDCDCQITRKDCIRESA